MELFKQNTHFDTSKEIDLSSPVSGLTASHALVTNIKFSTGKTSSIVTLFNAQDFSFEEINIGVNTSLKRQNWLEIIDVKTKFYSLKNGVLNYLTEFM